MAFNTMNNAYNEQPGISWSTVAAYSLGGIAAAGMLRMAGRSAGNIVQKGKEMGQKVVADAKEGWKGTSGVDLSRPAGYGKGRPSASRAAQRRSLSKSRSFRSLGMGAMIGLGALGGIGASGGARVGGEVASAVAQAGTKAGKMDPFRVQLGSTMSPSGASPLGRASSGGFDVSGGYSGSFGAAPSARNMSPQSQTLGQHFAPLTSAISRNAGMTRHIENEVGQAGMRHLASDINFGLDAVNGASGFGGWRAGPVSVRSPSEEFANRWNMHGAQSSDYLSPWGSTSGQPLNWKLGHGTGPDKGRQRAVMQRGR